MKHPNEVYKDGRKSCRMGESLEACPYSRDSKLFNWWVTGWNDQEDLDIINGILHPNLKRHAAWA